VGGRSTRTTCWRRWTRWCGFEAGAEDKVVELELEKVDKLLELERQDKLVELELEEQVGQAGGVENVWW
jgi:hypothetical protein